MRYATVEDIEKRACRTLTAQELDRCETLLDDAAVLVDTYNEDATQEAKKVVSCNIIVRLLGNGDATQFPIGATQGTVSALGYSQTFTMGNGSSGEMYLSRLDKKLLGCGQKIGFASPWEVP